MSAIAEPISKPNSKSLARFLPILAWLPAYKAAWLGADLIAQATQLGFLMLVVLGVAKLFATALLLATGWKGGYIFPIMFAGIAIGMAGKVLFPGVPTAVPVAAVLAGALAAAFRAPLFAALFTLTMVQAETAPVVAVAVLIGFVLSVLLGQRAARAAAAKAPGPVSQNPQLQP